MRLISDPALTVTTSSAEYVNYEVIYTMKKNNISVRVAQTNADEFPFISALEVRSLECYMYQFYKWHLSSVFFIENGWLYCKFYDNVMFIAKILIFAIATVALYVNSILKNVINI